VRIKGQETSIIVVRGNQVENTFDAIPMFNMEFESDVISVGYLGEKTERKDDIFKGVKFDFELHTSRQDWIRFLIAVHNRQKRNTPNLIINITTILEYPDGDGPQLTLPDVKFGATAMDIGSRADYVKKKLNGACDDYIAQLS
jgi:hypothetical protein